MLVLRQYTALLVASLFMIPAVVLDASAASPDVPDLGIADRLLDDLLGAESGQYVVGHGEEVPDTLQSLLSVHGGRLLRTDPVLAFSVVELPEATAEAFRQAASLLRDVRYVKADAAVQAHHTPNDPLYGQQWGAVAVGIESVWDTTFGNHSVEVAVLDTGVDYTHEDLGANVCRLGPDFINNDEDPMDDHYHGTHVSGTVAGVIDNNVGVAGMGNVCVVPVKVLSAGGSGTFSGVASGIRWAADNGVEIISMSLGGCCDPGEPVTSAIAHAVASDVLIIASAGNAHCGSVGYPAAYPEVVAVGATSEPGDEIAYFSSCGPEVEVSAPGHEIISSVPTSVVASGYASLSGTSMAAPHVSGVAAVFWSQYPDLSAAEVRCVLAQTSIDIHEVGRDVRSGFGRIDAAAMFASPSCVPQVPEVPVLNGRSGDLSAALQWNQPFAWGGVDGYNVYRGTDADNLTLHATTNATQFVDAGLTEGAAFVYAVEAYNGAGTSPRSAPVTVTVRAALTLPHTLDFESGFGDWTATGLWHVTTDRAQSGQSAYFGQENGAGLEDNSYDTGRSEYGTIESPPIRLPTGDVSMRFWQFFELESWWYEHPLIEIATESAPFAFQPVWEMGGWNPYEGPGAVDLGAHAGEVVYLRFVVDADAYDFFEGWYIDDVVIEAVAPLQHAPVTTIVYPYETTQYWSSSNDAAGLYTDPNGDHDVVNATLRVGNDNADAAELYGHYWRTQYGPLASGTHTLTATVRDSSGLEATDDVTIKVDGEVPGLTVSAPVAGSTVGCTLDLRGNATDTGGAGLSYLFVLRPQRTASIEWHVSYYDFAGEDTAPWEVTMDLTLDTAGPLDLTLRLYDRAGNRNETVFTIERDSQDCRPQIRLDAPSEGQSFACTVDARGSVTSPVGRDIRWVDVYIDGRYVGGDGYWGGGAEADFDITAALGNFRPGNHTLTVVAVDDAYAYNETSVVIVRDTTDCLPRANITSPSAGTLVGCSFTASGTASSPRSDVVGLWVELIMGGKYVGYATVGLNGEWSATVQSARVGAGVHDLVAYVQDSDGNSNTSAPLSVERDGTDCRPEVQITSPADGAEAGCTLVVSGTASGHDGTGLRWVDLYVDDSRWVGYDWLDGSQVEWTVKAKLRNISPGNHTLTARVTDDNGLTNVSAPLQFTRLDVQCATIVTVSSPAPGATVGGAVVIRGNVSFPDDDTGWISVYAGDTYLGERELSGTGGWAFDWNTWALENGTYEIVAEAYSSLGGWSQVAFMVDVVNERIPRVETFDDSGEIGCSAGILMLRTRDLCSESGSHRTMVDVGLTAARITVEWEGDLPADLETLAVELSVGSTVASVSGYPGDEKIVLEVYLDEPLSRPGEALVSVRAAYGSLMPSIAQDTPYTVHVDWAYFGAELPY